jgi:hypothetical protein
MGQTIDNQNCLLWQNTPKAPPIPIEVEFGNPVTKDCLRLGICRIYSMGRRALSLMPPCSGKAQGFLSRFEPTGIKLIFLKGNMAATTKNKYFNSGLFQINAAYCLPADLANLLGLTGFVVTPGNYPLLEMDDEIHLILT